MNTIQIILFVIISIFVTGIITIILVGSLSKPRAGYVPTKIVPQEGSFVKRCDFETVNCNVNTDCSSCFEHKINGEEMECVPLTADKNSRKICKTKNATIDCNLKNGYLILSENNYPERMEFNCICSDPSKYSGPSCNDIVPSFCAGGNYNPATGKCECPINLVLYELPSGPICVPKNQKDFYSNVLKKF